MPNNSIYGVHPSLDDNDFSLHPNHDEWARQRFVIDFKKKVNLELRDDIREVFEKKLQPKLEVKLGHELDNLSRDDRKAAKQELTKENLFHTWASMTYMSQDMMWDCVDEILDHDLPRLENITADLKGKSDQRGTLTLNPDLDIPQNISDVWIHRQPGGFCCEREGNDFDILAGARYTGGGMMYSAGKGRGAKPGGYSAAHFLIENIKADFQDFMPNQILDVGCGSGYNTATYATIYSNADVHGIDVAPGLLRWGNARAESLGQAIHFTQMNSADMDFEDESFDLIASTIWGHETTPSILTKSLSECWRVLRPGGVMFHMDVTTQPGYTGLADQVMNDWQVKYNGEPFWMGFADANIPAILSEIGCPNESIFTGHRKRNRGDGDWFCYGARKPK